MKLVYAGDGTEKITHKYIYYTYQHHSYTNK